MDIKSMTKLAAKGKMSRRDFVQLAMAAGVTAAAAQTGWWATNVSFAAVFGVATGLSLLFLLVLVPLARTSPPPPGEPQGF